MARYACLVLAAMLLGACEQMQTTDAGAVGVARPQRMSYLLPEDEVIRTADAAYDATLEQDESAGTLNTDQQQSERVEHIVHDLIRQTGVFRPQSVLWHWEVNVETSDQVTAYCSPSGKILVYSGALATLKPSDDELAALLAHEIAHALRDHLREKMSRAQYQTLGAQLLNAVTGSRHDSQVATSLKLVDQAYNAPYSAEQEAEADAIGLELAARAGYNPRAAISLLQKIHAMNKDKNALGTFLKTHPSNEAREAQLNALLPKVLPLYQAAHPH